MKKFFSIGVLALLLCVLLIGTAMAGQLDRAVVMISVDDGLASVYTQVYPTLVKKYGIPFMACIPTGHIDMDGDHVTSGQVVEMGLNQVRMCDHGDQHLDFTNMKYSLIKKDLKDSQVKWRKLGFYDVTVLAYPFGVDTATVVKAAKSVGMYTGRGSYDNLDQYNYPDTYDPWWIESLSFRNNTKTSDFIQMKKYIDGAVDNAAALSIVLHDVGPGLTGDYELDSSELDKTAAYLAALRAAGKIDIEFIDDAVINLDMHADWYNR